MMRNMCVWTITVGVLQWMKVEWWRPHYYKILILYKYKKKMWEIAIQILDRGPGFFSPQHRGPCYICDLCPSKETSSQYPHSLECKLFSQIHCSNYILRKCKIWRQQFFSKATYYFNLMYSWKHKTRSCIWKSPRNLPAETVFMSIFKSNQN